MYIVLDIFKNILHQSLSITVRKLLCYPHFYKLGTKAKISEQLDWYYKSGKWKGWDLDPGLYAPKPGNLPESEPQAWPIQECGSEFRWETAA